MEASRRLAGFAVALVAVFALAFGVGRALGPVDDAPAHPAPSHGSTHDPSHDPSQGQEHEQGAKHEQEHDDDQ